MRTIELADAQANLRAVLDQATADSDATLITVDGAPAAALMPFAFYSSLLETLHLLSAPANAAHLAKSLAQARSGQAGERPLHEGTPG